MGFFKKHNLFTNPTMLSSWLCDIIFMNIYFKYKLYYEFVSEYAKINFCTDYYNCWLINSCANISGSRFRFS